MPTALQIASIATTLDAYHSQLSALSQALGALREASDQMLAQLEKDRASIATLVPSQPSPTAEASEAAETEAVSASSRIEHDPVAGLDLSTADDIEPSLQAGADETASAAGTQLCAEAVSDTLSEISGGEARHAETIEAAPTITRADAAGAPEAFDGAEASASVADIDHPASTAIGTESQDIAAFESGDAVAASSSADDPKHAAKVDGAQSEGSETPGTETGGNVVPLAPRRQEKKASLPIRRRAMAIAASLVVMAGAALGTHELIQSGLGQRLVDLAVCDGDMLSANRNCALLAWLML